MDPDDTSGLALRRHVPGNTRPLRCWSALQVRQVCSLLEAELARWCAAWGWPRPVHVRPAPLESLDSENADVAAAVAWSMLHAAATYDAQVWIGLPRNAVAEVRSILLGADANARLPQTPDSVAGLPFVASMASSLAQRAWNDHLEGLRRMLAEPESPSSGTPQAPADVSAWPDALVAWKRAWSGALRIEVSLLTGPCTLVLGCERVAAILGGTTHTRRAFPKSAQAALVSLRDALSRRTFKLTADLGAVELSLGDLRSLRAGDVIPLPHALDQPLAVRSGSGPVLCRAWLGRQGSRRALRLERQESPAVAPQTEQPHESRTRSRSHA